MRKLLWLPAVLAAAAQAETHSLTLKQAVARALAQSPDVIMARLDQVKAAESVRIAREPFVPRVTGGSGLAWSNGFPLSIEGSAPSVFEAKASEALFNRPQTYAVAQARENERGAGFASGERRDEIVFRVATLFVDADRAARLAESVQKQVESLSKVLSAVETRVEAGRELPVARQEANVNVLRARQRLMALQAERDYAEHSVAASLGYDPGDAVHPAHDPADDERVPALIPASEDAAMQDALRASKELKRLESSYQAKVLEIKGNKAQRLPRVDLVAQYALFAKYDNYDLYFNRFKYNNGQLGASVQIPLLVGSGVKAQIMQGEADQQHIRAEIQAARSRIALEVHQSYQDIAKVEMARQVAKAELDLAHEQLSILLAQMNEGRAALKQVEEARFNEDEKWIAFYDAQFSAEKARLVVLRHTGELAAALR
ncbi:MAG: TolC family protein [Acidobacteriota bacterium]